MQPIKLCGETYSVKDIVLNCVGLIIVASVIAATIVILYSQYRWVF